MCSLMLSNSAVMGAGTTDAEQTASQQTPLPVAPTPYTHAPKIQQHKQKRAFKVIVIGDSNAGKTCLTFRFCNGRFPDRTEATIGVDFRERSILVEGELLRIQLWDTAGQERFRQSMVAHYYRNVNAVVYVYDVTRLTSFKSLTRWINECKLNGVGQEVPKILIGNKCDMPKEKVEVNSNEAQKFADSHDMPAFETSAKMDSESDHVESIFMTLIFKLKNSQQMHVGGSQSGEDQHLADCTQKIHSLTEPGAQSSNVLASVCC